MFRLRWVRLTALRQQLDHAPLDGGLTNPSEDFEVTLRPGESWPMDSVGVRPGAKTIEGRSCRGNSASIRVLVDHYPWEELDRRLVLADLWLIERLPDGTEAQRSQLSVRGSVKSSIDVKPEETVEIRLPKMDKDAGPFAGREFSIRIRARQLR